MKFESDFEFVPPGLLRGFVTCAEHPGQAWHVGLFRDGELLGTCTADSLTDPVCGWPSDAGFEFNLIRNRIAEQESLCLRVLNTDHVIAWLKGRDLVLTEPVRPRGPVGYVRHVQGLTLAGTITNAVTDLPAYEIVALEDCRIVGRSRLWRWQHVDDPENPLGRAAGFDLYLDPELADGLPHRIQVETSTGLALNGSPLDIVAWPNRLRDRLLEDARAGERDPTRRQGDMMLERLLGHSMPLSAYGALYPEVVQTDHLQSVEGAIGSDGLWCRIGETGWLLFWHRVVAPLAGFSTRVADVLDREADGELRMISCDLGVRQVDGQVFPLLLPTFDLERLMEQGYAALCFALPEEALEASEHAPTLIALLLEWIAPNGRLVDRAAILHLPHPGGVVDDAALVESCTARGQALAAALATSPLLARDSLVVPVGSWPRHPPRFPALRICRPPHDRAVSVIVPTRNQGEMLYNALNGLIDGNPGFDLDIVVVDNASDEAGTLEVFDALEARGVRVLEFREGFNFSIMNNLACEHTLHEQLCFMNNDVAFPETGVLMELCSRLSDPCVGAVGPLMTRSSDIIQHGGVVLGTWHGATHAFEDRMLGDPGYGELLRVASEPSAVTAAFMLTRKSLFLDAGGFDENLFAVNFGDVDYCLRLGAAGYRVVFTPHVRIQHLESVSRGREAGSPAGLRMQRELANLRARWRETLLNDPQFHPLFSIDSLPYRALAMSHRAPAARRAGGRRAAALPTWL